MKFPSFKACGQVFFAALIYYLFGKIALILAVPPGYSVPIWPSAGIALALSYTYGFRVLPGIFIGSFLLNLGIGPEYFSIPLSNSFMAAQIGMGAVLEAWVGTRLARFTLGSETPLENIRQVAAFFILAGVAPCFLNALWGNSILALHHVVKPENLLFSIFTWWAGDAIGIFLFAPFTLVFIGRPRKEWASRFTSLTLPMAIVLLIIVSLFFTIKKNGERHVTQLFESRCQNFYDALQRILGEDLIRLRSIKSLYDSSNYVDRDEFRSFAKDQLSYSLTAKALEWVPKVKAGEVEMYVRKAEADGVKGFGIKEKRRGEWVPAGSREIYFPLYYLEPASKNQRELGFDMISVKERAEAMKRAQDSGDFAATASVGLASNNLKKDDYSVVFFPVYEKGASLETNEMRHQALKGFLTEIFHIPDVIKAVYRAEPNFLNLSVELMDVTDSPRGVIVYRGDIKKIQFSDLNYKSEKPILFAGRSWRLQFYSSSKFFQPRSAWSVWLAMALCFAFAGLLGAFILVVTGQTWEIRRVVEIRTAELRKALDDLRETGRKVEDQKKLLEKVNRELDSFVHTASHDMRTPLRGVTAFAEFLFREYGAGMDQKAQDYLAEIRKGAKGMKELLDELLELSKISRVKNPYHMVSVEEMIGGVLQRLKYEIEKNAAEIKLGPHFPVIRCDRIKMTEVFYNLIGNAIKFSSKRESGVPCVEIGYRDDPEGHLFFIKDNGIGIDVKFHDEIFSGFRKLHSQKVYEGHGIGLNIVRRVIEDHEGRIWVESEPSKGAAFYFLIPKKFRNESVPGPVAA